MDRAKFLDERRYIACNNEEAIAFLVLWNDLLESADDVVDENTTTEFKISTYELFNRVYSHPYYLKHLREFTLLVSLINNAYADSEEAMKSNLPWKKELGDVLRHSSGEMIRAVALLEGGWQHLRSMSMKFWEACYYQHHSAEGKPE